MIGIKSMHSIPAELAISYIKTFQSKLGTTNAIVIRFRHFRVVISAVFIDANIETLLFFSHSII